MSRTVILNRALFDAVVFDLDGVLTSTRALHVQAWQSVFDEFLAARSADPFDVVEDYRRYVDGRPRYDGVRRFLASRGLQLPEGNPDDPPGDGSVCALGNRKNGRFVALLAARGATAYDDMRTLLQALRDAGFRLAVVTSSCNGAEVLESAGLADWFEVRLDGVSLTSRQLAGKPAPDQFLAAAADLGVSPRRAVVVEDATAGVAAGDAGGFGCVIGVARDGAAGEGVHGPAGGPAEEDPLLSAGADVVVGQGSDIGVLGPSASPVPVLTSLEGLERRLAGRRLLVCLDYDGTLTPIVERPELAVLPSDMRVALADLARAHTTAVISGRDLEDVRRLVGLDGLVYAGSHGFDIRLPDGTQRSPAQAESARPALAAAASVLRDRLSGVPGALLEPKRFSLAVHYRMVADDQVDVVRRAVDGVLADQRGLRLGHGKRVFELLPDLPWDKGRAVLWLLDAVAAGQRAVPLYVGDDLTDETAFTALAGHGVGMVVMDELRASSATYRLDDPAAVGRLLRALAGIGGSA